MPLSSRRAMLALALAALLFQAHWSARAGDRPYRLTSVAIETVGRENYLQIACAPEAVESQARVRLTLGDTVITLRQDQSARCDGSWAPIWAAQPMRLIWLVEDEVLIGPGEHLVEMWDADWLLGPRRRVASRFVFRDDRRGRQTKFVPEGYVLTLTYAPARSEGVRPYGSSKDGGAPFHRNPRRPLPMAYTGATSAR